MRAQSIPKPFLVKKLHSLTGLWLVLFLAQHLFTNSQASLWLGEDGIGFIRAVNGIHELPFLVLIEIFLLGVPIAIHGWWGILYARKASLNSFATAGNAPSLPYRENRAFTWQRFTSWVLLVGIVAHVVHMRFWEAPKEVRVGMEASYMVSLQLDRGLYTLSERLGFQIFDQQEIAQLEERGVPLVEESSQQQQEQEQEWLDTLSGFPLGSKEGVAVTPSFGMAELLVVRESFKSFWMISLYSIFVIASTFHAFNGLWTAMISWGVTLTNRSQNLMRMVANGLFLVVLFLGMAAIWGTYWINLRN